MQETYQAQEIESTVQTLWETQRNFEVKEDLSKEKFYSLCMFPYPSGQLHVGHVRNYTIGDVIARYQRMLGKNVLQPMGWDAFGLPAENAAIKHKSHPAAWTYQNIDHMRAQLKQLGLAYDWSRELTTCHDDYYRWEQWLFVRLFKKGLVYRKNAVVNWDPVDQTVLANEQVVNGCGWRSGAPIERREIAQWFIKITDYADELLDDLEQLKDWPEKVRTMQHNWIGRSRGVECAFKVSDQDHTLNIFTTRIDTICGVTFLALAPQHPLAQQAAQHNSAIAEFIAECGQVKVAEADMATMEKKGIDSGFTAINPVTGKTMPIWIANFVLMEYGNGAVMAVPAHDRRDHEFATRYQLPITPVIKSTDDQAHDFTASAYNDYGILYNSGQFDGLHSEQALEQITHYLQQGKLAKNKVHYRLRDWGISRQRYWGTPIPMIRCDNCGDVPVPEKDLPVKLPEDVEFTGTQSPLTQLESFYQTTCPECGQKARRETDTFDTFMESSWYYARFACPDQSSSMLDGRASYWTPVDHYIGGVEHAVMHLLYARFIHKVLRDENLLNSDEPFTRLLTQGMVLKDGSKMSKSKGNTVDPQALIDRFGADTLRLFILFAAPPEQSLDWSDSGVEGAHRFLKRLWHAAYQQRTCLQTMNEACQDGVDISMNSHTFGEQTDAASSTLKETYKQLHQILKKADYDMSIQQFNTIVSAAMKMLNLLSRLPVVESLTPAQVVDPKASVSARLLHSGFSMLLRLLAPMTPHIAQKLWQDLGYGNNIIDAPWPKVVKSALKSQTLNLIVQVNGKRRGEISVAHDADNGAIEASALADPNVARYLVNKVRKKTIIVPGKLVNIVASEAEL